MCGTKKRIVKMKKSGKITFLTLSLFLPRLPRTFDMVQGVDQRALDQYQCSHRLIGWGISDWKCCSVISLPSNCMLWLPCLPALLFNSPLFTHQWGGNSDVPMAGIWIWIRIITIVSSSFRHSVLKSTQIHGWKGNDRAVLSNLLLETQFIFFT